MAKKLDTNIIKQIQAAVGVVADGILGPITYKAILRTLGHPTTKKCKTTLIRNIQQVVGVTADGVFGAKTLAATYEAIMHVPVQEEEQATTELDANIPDVPFNDIDTSDLIDKTVYRKCKETLFVFETGTREGDYGNVSIYKDGGGGKYRQITYGAAQTTQDHNLDSLLRFYIDAVANFNSDDTYANILEDYLPTKGKVELTNDKKLINTLKAAGKDKVMQYCQDVFFQDTYFQPAYKWFKSHGFTLPLSMLVIYDSFIHSGSILSFLRKRFDEAVPSSGGDEKKWIQDYVRVRKSWLANHSNKILRNTVYRMNTMQTAIDDGNWMLEDTIYANGEEVV